MNVNTTRFGMVEIDESSIIRMPRGPLGFEEQTEYCLLQHRPDSTFRWLQSVDEACLAFVVVDPSEFFTDYEIDIPDSEAEKLHLESADDALVLVVVAITNEGKEITVNLAAPIVINSKNLTGLQVVLQDSRYTVNQSLVQKSAECADNKTKDNREEVAALKAA